MSVTNRPHLHQDWIDSHALGIVKALQKSGYITYLVGGCVRDLLLNVAPKDFDIATSALPDEVRKIIYTTNAIESLHSQLRKAVRVRGHFPSDEAASKLMFLVLREVSKNWKMPPREWSAARTQFAVIFGERFVAL